MEDRSQRGQSCANLGKSRGQNQVSGRLNKPRPEPTRWGHLSPTCAKENRSPTTQEKGTRGQAPELCGVDMPAQALAWPSLSSTLLTLQMGQGSGGPHGPEALIWAHFWVGKRALGFEGPEKKPSLVSWPLLNRILVAQERVAGSPNPSPGTLFLFDLEQQDQELTLRKGSPLRPGSVLSTWHGVPNNKS